MYKLGIDLGTTFSAVSVYDATTGESRTLSLDENAKNEEQGKLFPSVIMWDAKKGDFVYGWKAYRALQRGQKDVAATFKRSMGQKQSIYPLNGKLYTGEELSEMLLRKMRELASAKLGEEITEAVITVPAYFTSDEKRETRDAGLRAGFKKIIRLVNEPTAAAISYCYNKWNNGGILLIFDLGGGTFDVTLCRMTRGYALEVLASVGDSRLGGKNWDEAVQGLFLSKLQAAGADITDSSLISDVRSRAEELKKDLNEMAEVPAVFTIDGVDTPVSVTQAEFEEVTKPLLLRCEQILKSVIAEVRKQRHEMARFDWIDLDEVLLVGGSTRLEQVKRMIRAVTGHEPARNGIDPDKVVSVGAAIDAHMKHSGVLTLSSARTTLTGEKKQESRGTAFIESGIIIDKTPYGLGTIAISPDLSKYINDIVIPKQADIPKEYAIAESFLYDPSSPETDHMDVYTVQEKHPSLEIRDVEKLYVITGFPAPGKYEVHIQYSYDESSISNVQAKLSNGQPLQVAEKDRPSDEKMEWIKERPKVKRVSSGSNMTVFLSIDVSGSMTEKDADPSRSQSRIDAAKDAMYDFIGKLSKQRCPIGVIATADTAILVQEPTTNYNAVKDAVRRSDSVGAGGGSTAHPFDIARTHFDAARDRECVLIILADGEWYGNAPSQSINAVKEFKRKKYRTVAIGFGDANKPFLQSISTSDKDAILTSGSLLKETFGSIAVSLQNQHKSGSGAPERRVVPTW